MVSGSSVTVAGTNVGATKQLGEPAHAGSPGGKSIWYSWVATGSGTTSISLAGSAFDAVLAVYTGNSVNALTRVASSYGGGAPVRVNITTVKGRTYKIAIDGKVFAGGVVTSGGTCLTISAPVTANVYRASATAIVPGWEISRKHDALLD